MSEAAVIVETLGQVTTVTLNRPAQRNALNLVLLEQLAGALAAAERDLTQRILILRGAGPVFCAGLDLGEAADPQRAHRSAELIAQVLLALSSTPLVTIAAVHGAAIAGGAGLMTACDLAVAAEGTQIGYPETRRGLVAGLVMTFLRRQVRERDARELLLSGELIGAGRARDIGLVNRVAAPDQLLSTVKAWTEAVLQGGPDAIRGTKKLWAELSPQSVAADLQQALAAHLRARHSPEAIEGVAAFREKRAPSWASGAIRSAQSAI